MITAIQQVCEDAAGQVAVAVFTTILLTGLIVGLVAGLIHSVIERSQLEKLIKDIQELRNGK